MAAAPAAFHTHAATASREGSKTVAELQMGADAFGTPSLAAAVTAGLEALPEQEATFSSKVDIKEPASASAAMPAQLAATLLDPSSTRAADSCAATGMAPAARRQAIAAQDSIDIGKAAADRDWQPAVAAGAAVGRELATASCNKLAAETSSTKIVRRMPTEVSTPV